MDLQMNPGQDLLAGRRMGRRIMDLSMTLLGNGVRESSVARELLDRFAITAETARECARTAMVIRRAMLSQAFSAAGDPVECSRKKT